MKITFVKVLQIMALVQQMIAILEESEGPENEG